MTQPLPPGATLGVFGGGQLGRMFATAAARLGYRTCVFAPDDQPPAAHTAHQHIRAAYDDEAAVHRFIQSVDAITYEFENIPTDTVRLAAAHCPVCPGPEILAVTRHRLREKTFLRDHDIPVTPFTKATRATDLPEAARIGNGHVILKTVEFGYDGKGQTTFGPGDDPHAAWQTLGNPNEVIVEQAIDLAAESSVLIARDTDGGLAVYGPFYNTHASHILDTTTWAATDSSAIAETARTIGRTVAEAFDLHGLLCVECFISGSGAVLVNEIAPRPHNSGHLTIEALSISQFEQQARLTAGHAAVSPVPQAPAAAMANLLGDCWAHGEPDWTAVLDDPRVRLHLYGKTDARPGRKMGHLTACAATADAALDRVRRARDRLRFPIVGTNLS